MCCSNVGSVALEEASRSIASVAYQISDIVGYCEAMVVHHFVDVNKMIETITSQIHRLCKVCEPQPITKQLVVSFIAFNSNISYNGNP